MPENLFIYIALAVFVILDTVFCFYQYQDAAKRGASSAKVWLAFTVISPLVIIGVFIFVFVS